MTSEKICVRCKQVLPMEAFHSWKTRQGIKFGRWCQKCYIAINASREKRRFSLGEK